MTLKPRNLETILGTRLHVDRNHQDQGPRTSVESFTEFHLLRLRVLGSYSRIITYYVQCQYTLESLHIYVYIYIYIYIPDRKSVV